MSMYFITDITKSSVILKKRFSDFCKDSTAQRIFFWMLLKADQLQRAGTSVSLNIAEGAGEYSGSEKGRFYRMAKRSATECAGIFEICDRLELIEEGRYLKAGELLI